MVSTTIKVKKNFTTSDFASLVRTANGRVASAPLKYKGSNIDLKSILGVCSICLTKGSEFVIELDGDDERILAAEIENFFE